jgi:hypothetical protein
MPTSLTAGYKNNINTIQIRTSGSGMQRVTDRRIDIDGDGDLEYISVVHVSGHAAGTPEAPGGKKTNTTTIHDGFSRTVIQTVVESDGGVTTDANVSEYTKGVE